MNKQTGIVSLITGLIFVILGWIDMASEEGASGKTAVMFAGGVILVIIGATLVFSSSSSISQSVATTA